MPHSCAHLNGRLYSACISENAMRHLLNWVLSALGVWVVARLIPGFHVSGPLAALIAALAIGFINATLGAFLRSEEHTSELQSHSDLVCRLLLEKKNGRQLVELARARSPRRGRDSRSW